MKSISHFQNPPKYLVILLIFMAVLFRFEREVFAPIFHTDQERYLVTTDFLLSGKGVSLAYADTTDISKSITKAYSAAAEGYSYLLAPLKWITNSAYWTMVIPNLLAILLYLFSWIFLYNKFRESIKKSSFIPFLLLFSFGASPYIHYGSTDLIAISFYWFALVILIPAITEKKYGFSLLSGVFLFLSYYLRFAYIPLMIIPPVSLIILFIFYRNRVYLKSLMTLSSVFLVLLLVSFMIKTHDSTYIASKAIASPEGFKFYIENLLHFNISFGIQAFTDNRFIYSVLSKLKLQNLVEIVSFLFSFSILIILVLISLQKIKTYKNTKNKYEKESYLFLVSWFMIGITIAELSYMSIKTVPETSDAVSFFTYVSEIRYFAPVFTALLFLTFFFSFHKEMNSIYSKILKWFLIFLSFMSLFYYPMSKYIEYKSTNFYLQTGDKKLWSKSFNDENLGSEIKSLIDSSFIDGVRPVFLCHDRSSFAVEVMGAEYGGSIANSDLSKIKTSRDIYLLINISENDLYACKNNFLKFIHENKLSPVLENSKNKIYKIKILKNI